MIKQALLNYKNQSKKVYLNTKNFFKPEIFVKLADSKSEIKQAQKLRYQVFFSDRNKKKILNIGNFRKDSDKYDSYSDHVIVNYKHSKFSKNKVIGTYRLLQQKVAEKKIGFYSAEEFCLDKLIQSDEYTNMLELSRSCISQKVRNRNVLKLMWKEIYNYINTNKIDGMFGTASFLEIDIQKINNQLLFLQQNYKMPENIKVKARKYCSAKIDYSKNIKLNLKLVKSLPTLIKGYIKLNAYIGDGAVIDYKFKTTDVFVFLPSNKINKEYVEKIV